VLRDDFVEKQMDAEYRSTHADVRTDNLAVAGVRLHVHAPTARHPRRLAHVRGKVGVIVHIVKNLYHGSGNICNLLVMPHLYLSIIPSPLCQ